MVPKVYVVQIYPGGKSKRVTAEASGDAGLHLNTCNAATTMR